MTEEEVENEAREELKKPTFDLIKDSIREANSSKGDNLDLIKHLIKRLAIHQLILEERANKTNCLLLLMTIILVILTIVLIIKP